MKVDFLLVGQGIAGTLLSYQLRKAGKRVLVLDEGSGGKASRVAAAVINPLSGKGWTPSRDAAFLIPAAVACYRELEGLLQKQFLHRLPLYLFHTEQEHPFRSSAAPLEQLALGPYFYDLYGASKLEDTWLVDAAVLLDSWTAYLQQEQALLLEPFVMADCRILPEAVFYKDIEAEKIVFCEGAAGGRNPLFTGLPFTRNRGEALLLHIPGLPSEALYHRDLRLVPRSDGRFWCGSNYQWNFQNLEPDSGWRAEAIKKLAYWLRLPCEVTDHIVAERPTTAGQIPFVGLHPQFSAVALLNGLGTRGFSSGPFWAEELARQLADPHYRIRNYNEDWLRTQFG